MSGIADRLAAARRRAFAGRVAELAVFREALAADEPPFCVLYLYGPGGAGKSTLLAEYADMCAESGVRWTLLDARNFEPSPAGFLGALRSTLNLDTGDDPVDTLGKTGRHVLFVDTYERLASLDGWLRESFLPRLGSDVIVVMAGRLPLPSAWRNHAGWQSLLRTLPLRNLSAPESRAFLERRSVPVSQHAAAIRFTHGHPLALSLLADVLIRPESPGAGEMVRASLAGAEAPPDVVQALLERFLEGVPGPLHRAALDACALVRVADEGLLREMLAGDIPAEQRDEAGGTAWREEIRGLFEWLGSLSFIAASMDGLFPHDTVRETLLSDLRWRDRDRYVQLHARARDYYAVRLKAAAHPAGQQRLLYDCIFLHRDNAVVRAAFDWRDSPTAYPDTLRESDKSGIVSLVRRLEGDESATVAAGWLERQPERTVVFRDPGDDSDSEPAGFFTMLLLGPGSSPETNLEDSGDPAMAAASRYLERNAPLRAGECATYLRFWMARDSYQDPSPVQSLIIVHALRHFLTGAHLAFTFFACSAPELWEPVFDYVQIGRLRDVEFEADGRTYGVYGHDWRSTPASAWLERLFENEVAAGGGTVESRPVPEEPPLVVLSQSDFANAVRDALKGLRKAGALPSNPLLRSRIVASQVPAEADTGTRIEALRRRILTDAARLRDSPKQARGYRALHLTYLEPSGTQEQAADRLNLPFNTYRRHLGEGIAALTELLWRDELGIDSSV